MQTNFIGQAVSAQRWTWQIYDWTTSTYVTLGDNTGASDWVWSPLSFNASGTLAHYVNSAGQIRIALGTNNASDNCELDYEAVVVGYSGGGPAPTATNTPVNTATATRTNTPVSSTNTPTTVPTIPPVNTPTNTPVNTATNTPTTVPTIPPVNTPTNTPVNTATATRPTPVRTNTPTTVPTIPPVNTPTNTPVPPTATSTPGQGGSVTLAPVSYTTLSGTSGGQPVSALAVQDQSGTQDTWNDYVEFDTVSAAPYYQGYRTYTLPGTVSPSSVTALQIRANYMGDAAAEQRWTWHVYDWTTSTYVTLGDNTGAGNWAWHLLTFNASGTLSHYVNSSGQIRIEVDANNAADNFDLDYEAVVVTHS